MPHKIKLVYAGDEPGHEHRIEIWTEGVCALVGHVMDSMLGTYSAGGNQQPMRIEITPNSPDTPTVQNTAPEDPHAPD